MIFESGIVLVRFLGSVNADGVQSVSSDNTNVNQLGHPFVEPCWHGTFDNKSQSCTCDPDWRRSGPTDTIQFLKGACDQYMCESDDKCIRDTGFDFAQCIVPTWNCYCGWKEAWKNTATGYEMMDPTKSNGGGKCMGVLYVVSIEGAEFVKWWSLHSWKLFLALAVILLPFGQTHVRCQHHEPYMFRMFHKFGVLRLCGWNYHCNGRCIVNS